MIKVKIFSIGKTRESWLEQALTEYFKRLKNHAKFECIWVKDNPQLEAMVQEEKGLICLDSTGKMMTSESFASFFFQQLVFGGSKVSFVIGGPEGLPANLKQNHKDQLISLSLLTYTHQLVRLVLIEQIYRSIEILKGSKYHK